MMKRALIPNTERRRTWLQFISGMAVGGGISIIMVTAVLLTVGYQPNARFQAFGLFLAAIFVILGTKNHFQELKT